MSEDLGIQTYRFEKTMGYVYCLIKRDIYHI